MRFTVHAGCAIILALIFTSCPRNVPRFQVHLENLTSSRNVVSITAQKLVNDNYEPTSDNLLPNIVVAGQEIDFSVRLDEIGDGTGLEVELSGGFAVTQLLPQGFQEGMEMEIECSSFQDDIDINIEVDYLV